MAIQQGRPEALGLVGRAERDGLGEQPSQSMPRRTAVTLATVFTCEAGHRTPANALERLHVNGEVWVRCPICDAEEQATELSLRGRQ